MCLAHVRVIIAAKGEDNKLIELKGAVSAGGWQRGGHVERGNVQHMEMS